MSNQPRNLLEIYLHDHIAASVGGRELVRRIERRERQSAIGAQLRALRADIEADGQCLREITEAMGISPRAPFKAGAAWLLQQLGRLKLNGRFVRHSPLSLLLELEGLQMAVRGKRALWQTLSELGRVDPRLESFDLARLIARADDQLERIQSLHERAARDTFAAEPAAAE